MKGNMRGTVAKGIRKEHQETWGNTKARSYKRNEKTGEIISDESRFMYQHEKTDYVRGK